MAGHHGGGKLTFNYKVPDLHQDIEQRALSIEHCALSTAQFNLDLRT